MGDHDELLLRWEGTAARWWTAPAALAAVAAGTRAGLGAQDAADWGALSAVLGVGAIGCALVMLGRRVEAGPAGLRFRTVLRWRRLMWEEIVRFEDLRVEAVGRRATGPHLRVAAVLRDGSEVSLPVPWVGGGDVGEFERDLSRPRALHRRYAGHTQGS